MNLKKQLRKLRNLPQYKNATDEELKQVIENLHKKDEDLDLELLFSSVKERRQAQALLQKYLRDYHIETISDKNLLKQIIYCEVLAARLQKILNNIGKPGSKVPIHVIDAYHRTLNQVIELKEKLGITKEQQQKQNVFDVIQTLKKKFKIWRENNLSRHVICPYCGQVIWLKIRTDAYEASKHPFLKDRVLSNEHLVKLYQEGKITKNDVAQILECSDDYINWLINRWKNEAKMKSNEKGSLKSTTESNIENKK